MEQVRSHVLPLIDDAGPRLLIEPTAGGGGALASDVDSIGAYLDALDDARVGVCLDTCHLHAAGHDLRTQLRSTVNAIARRIGRGRIGLVHVNDSRDPCGSKRDRHASVGSGSIGLDGLRDLFAIAALRGVAMVVETDDTGHAADIAALKALRTETGRQKAPASAG
jgi:deoxyribonuclease-4